MTIAVVADAHLGGPGGPAEEMVEQLRALPEQGATRLVLLGDLFHVWIGDRRYETAEIRAVVDALRWLRSQGVRVDYIEGNRDFFLDGSDYEDAFDGLHLELEVEQGGRRFLFVHGDGLNEKDRKYRFWRWLSKSPPSRFLFRRIPGPLARRIVHSTEQQLAKSNFHHKSRIPVEVLEHFAAERLAAGLDEIVLGHFHDEFDLAVAGGRIRVMDAWFHHRTMQWIGRSTPTGVTQQEEYPGVQ